MRTSCSTGDGGEVGVGSFPLTERLQVGQTEVNVDSSDKVPNSHVSTQPLWKQ